MGLNRVYILGAGASSELRFTSEIISLNGSVKQNHSIKGPLSSGFFFYSNMFLKEVEKFYPFQPKAEINNKWLIDFIQKKYGITLDQLFEDENESKRVNIEHLYRQMEDNLARIEKDDELATYTEAYLGLTSLIEFIHSILADIQYYCQSLLHRILAYWIHQAGGNVISFNWDTLLDDELYGLGGWSYTDGYAFSAARIFDKVWDTPRQSGYMQNKTSKHILLKPHGSINWYGLLKNNSVDVNSCDEICVDVSMARAVGASIPRRKLTTMQVRKFNKYFQTLIIPPGYKRHAFPMLWDRAREFIRSADEIVCIGFSLNNFDQHIVEELEGISTKKDLVIKIVNPNESVVQHYQKIFPYAKIERPFDSFGKYCQWLVLQPGMESFSDLSKDLFG